MAKFSLCLLLLFAVLVGHGIVELEATHHIYSRLQTPQNETKTPWDYRFQPYRTGYHFQPPWHWINGNFLPRI